MWSVCLGLSSAFLDFPQALSCHDRFSYDLLDVFAYVLSCFLFDGLAYFCVLYTLFLSPLSTIAQRFVVTARGGDDILDFSGLLVALATVGVLCWNMSVIVSLMVSMSSSSCCVSNSLTLFVWHLFLVAS